MQKVREYFKRFKIIYICYTLALTFMAKIELFILNYLIRIPKRVDDKKVIVSLASWSARLNYLAPCLESLLKQKFKADRIILWLDNECKNIMPDYLKEFEDKGIEIKFTENIRSYKKIIPALQYFPSDIIITVDDDVSYPRMLTALLYKSYVKKPHLVHAQMVKKFIKNKNYIELKSIDFKEEDCSNDNIPIGVGGILYPGLAVFNQDVLKQDLFLRLAPKQDDLWLWYMLKLNNKPVVKIKNHVSNILDYIVDETTDSALFLENVVENDHALARLYNHYGK